MLSTNFASMIGKVSYYFRVCTRPLISRLLASIQQSCHTLSNLNAHPHSHMISTQACRFICSHFGYCLWHFIMQGLLQAALAGMPGGGGINNSCHITFWQAEEYCCPSCWLGPGVPVQLLLEMPAEDACEALKHRCPPAGLPGSLLHLPEAHGAELGQPQLLAAQEL